MQKLQSLKELKSLKGTLVAKGTKEGVTHAAYSFKDKNGVKFIPAAFHSNETVAVLEGPKIGGFNSSELNNYLRAGYSYSEKRKSQIKNKANLTRFTKALFPFIMERYNKELVK